MAFPTTPTVGDQYTTPGGTVYEWVADGAWKKVNSVGSTILAATQAEADAGILNNVYISPATLKDKAFQRLIITGSGNQLDWGLTPGVNVPDSVDREALGYGTIAVNTSTSTLVGDSIVIGEDGFYGFAWKTNINANGGDQNTDSRDNSRLLINGAGVTTSSLLTTRDVPAVYFLMLELSAGDTINVQVSHQAGGGRDLDAVYASLVLFGQ